MIKPWIMALFLGSPWVLAQPGIAPPQLGFVEDSAHALRPAYGVAGNLILGPAVFQKIIAESFSGSVGLLKTDSSLAAFDSQGKPLASLNTAPGAALLAFSPSGAIGLAYIAASRTLVEWTGSAFVPVPVDIADTVIAIAFPTPLEASLMVQRRETVWQLNVPLSAVGAISQNALMGVHPPLLALPAGDLVYRDDSGIVIRRTDGAEVHVAASLPASFSMQQMNRDWVQLSDLISSARFAIRTTAGREGFYRLPE